MNTQRKSVSKKDNIVILYQQENVIIFKGNEGVYFELNEYFTTDVMEAVALLMKSPSLKKSSLWNMKISVDEYNILNILYWLSGGDDFWKNPDLKTKWVDVYPMLLNQFEDFIIEASECETLNDIRLSYHKNLNLDVFYEFALKNNII